MPFVMSLEAPRLTPLDDARSDLVSALPRPLWRARAELSGAVSAACAHPVVIALGLIAGAWLAGPAGQVVVRRYFQRRK